MNEKWVVLIRPRVGVAFGDNEVENVDPLDMFEPRARRLKTRHRPEHLQSSNPKFLGANELFRNANATTQLQEGNNGAFNRQVDPLHTYEAGILISDGDRIQPALVVPASPSQSSSFYSVSENLNLSGNTPQSSESHSERTPEVAMYCGALQLE